MKTVTVQVTEEDIRDGQRHSCLSCPVAKAIGRATGKWCQVVCSCWWLRNRIPLRLPDDAITFIDRFDRQLAVKPISFEISY
jgi:hypothetical protein